MDVDPVTLEVSAIDVSSVRTTTSVKAAMPIERPATRATNLRHLSALTEDTETEEGVALAVIAAIAELPDHGPSLVPVPLTLREQL